MDSRKGRSVVGLLLLVALASGRAQGATLKSESYTINQADCGKTIVMSGGPHIVTLPGPAGFKPACSISVCNGNANASGEHAVLLDGFPPPLFPRLYMQQCAGVVIASGAWAAASRPERFRPNFSPELYVDNHGDDKNDGLLSNALNDALATPAQCFNIFQNEYDLITRQPTCILTGGQVFKGGVRLVGPMVGTSVMHIDGKGGVATIRAERSTGQSAMLLADFAPYLITRNISYDCIGAAADCTALFLHQQTGVDLNTGTTLVGDRASQVGLLCDSLCKVNQGADGTSPLSISGTFGVGISGALGSQFELNMGIGVADNTTISSSLIWLRGGSSILLSGSLNAGTGVTVAEIFTLRTASTACLAHIATAGKFGGARQYSVLNGAVLVNTSTVALPGSVPGFVALVGYAPGFAPDGAGGNTGVNAGGC